MTESDRLAVRALLWLVAGIAIFLLVDHAVDPNFRSMQRHTVLVQVRVGGDGAMAASGVITEHGIVTAHHVVSYLDDDMSVWVQYYDGRWREVEVRKTGSPDLALLSSPTDDDPAPIKCDPVSVGTRVYTVGHPMGYRWIVSDGIVSSHVADIRAEEVPYLYLDTSIVGGNSGGPAFNRRGEVIGIIQSGIVSGMGTGASLGRAIPGPALCDFLS